MSRDSSGNYTLPPDNPVVAGTVITDVWANTTMDDIAQALTDSLDRYGRGGMQAPFRFADGTAPAPGAAWALEPSTGFWREGIGLLNVSILGIVVAQFNPGGITIPTGVTVTLTDPPVDPTDAANRSYVDAADTTTLNSSKAYTDAAVGALAPPVPGQLTISPTDITASRALTAADFGVGIIRVNAGAAIALTLPTLAAMGLPLTPGKVRTIAFEIIGAGIPTWAGATAATSINGVNGPTVAQPVAGTPLQYQYVVLSQAASGADAWLLN
jgi:hypothetical protein